MYNNWLLYIIIIIYFLFWLTFEFNYWRNSPPAQTSVKLLLKMAVSFSNTHLRIPEGFSELLMGLSKEVLRDQPEDIPSFAAHYFKELLKQRAGTDWLVKKCL